MDIGRPVPKKKIFKGFTIYEHGGHLSRVTWVIYIYIGCPLLQMLRGKFGFKWPSGFREEDL